MSARCSCLPTRSARATSQRVAMQTVVEASTGLFDCNICLESARNPVITVCGHLYCWPCIYKWMRTTPSQCPLCPICKAGLSEASIIPLYGRGRPHVDPRKEDRVSDEAASPLIPARPAAQRRSPASDRPSPPPTELFQRPSATIVAAADDAFFSSTSPTYGGSLHGHVGGGVAGGGGGLVPGSAGSGGRPSFLGLQFIFPPHGAAQDSGRDLIPSQLSEEQAQQAYLSRLLLLLGSFVILCLLLF